MGHSCTYVTRGHCRDLGHSSISVSKKRICASYACLSTQFNSINEQQHVQKLPLLEQTDATMEHQKNLVTAGKKLLRDEDLG